MTNTMGMFERFSHETAIARARALAPSIRSRAKQSEEMRQQPKETIQEFIDSGLIRLLQPVMWGGHQLHIDSLCDAIKEIAKADPSAGWCFALLGLHSWMLTGWPEQSQLEVWGDNPNALIASAFAPTGKTVRTDGGYRIHGEWPFSSGIDHSDWAMLGSIQPPSEEGGFPQHLMLLVNKEQFEIMDDWYVAGIKGSGSKRIVIKEPIFVPDHRIVNILRWSKYNEAPGLSLHSGPVYTLPLQPIIPFFLASCVLGATQGAYELWIESAKKKHAVFTQTTITEFTHQQIRLSESGAELEAAELLLKSALGVVRDGGPLTVDQKVRIARDYAYMTKMCARVMQRLFENSGASSIYESNPMQRYWRDIQIMSMHVGLNFDFAGENFGRHVMGLPINPKNAAYL
ncbi:acyl-CoA dehydrogenase family protein [Paenibacillus periandrae]|uniref:acyl-CoA dehydrogenase family protein n=1 Tax=Paenibacillus periandrae TaxID=1761741 RepID=UPI001F08C89F|nr:acyl-CoA dehydrogenase family protein [Paenibacillus periandrae]